MKIKVCGMKNPDNIKDLSTLPIDFMGMIFYSKSPRYVEHLSLDDLNILPQYVKRVGVFVNEKIDFVKDRIKDYQLDIIQLHGNESPDFCDELSKVISVIKVFSVSETKDINDTNLYEGLCDYFLFDTKTPEYGGSGLKFDWSILDTYEGKTPFFVSGGISMDDIEQIRQITHPSFYGIDLNSKFEIEPALKNIDSLQQFIRKIRIDDNL